jgi:hypothetical protein
MVLHNEFPYKLGSSVLDMPFPDMERVHSGSQRNRQVQVGCGGCRK